MAREQVGEQSGKQLSLEGLGSRAKDAGFEVAAELLKIPQEGKGLIKAIFEEEDFGCSGIEGSNKTRNRMQR